MGMFKELAIEAQETSMEELEKRKTDIQIKMWKYLSNPMGPDFKKLWLELVKVDEMLKVKQSRDKYMG